MTYQHLRVTPEMTPEQYERWKDFSHRMVNVAVGARKRKPSRAMVLENIDFFFECRMDPYDAWRFVVNWDHVDTNEDGRRDYAPCDHVADLHEVFIPGYWSLPYEDEKPGVYDAAVERWVGPISCCIRAGIDVAVNPSAGVCGFTAGDIRKMYPEGVPDWVKEFFQSGELVSLHPTNIDGIYHPENHGWDARTFDELPDTQGVWL